MSGSITYNGEGFDSFQVARTVAYVSQTDVHQAQVTVRETLDFAARCLGTGHKQSEFHVCSCAAFAGVVAALATLW
jgi:ABC-type multidrug transport system ATPase subunit